jgi:alkylation response protein AidB-like acyl-CoA dehydrogenase
MTGHRAPLLILNDEQRMLAKTAREFIRERAPAARIRSFRDSKDWLGFSQAVWREMAELGWLGLQIPEQHDGLGLGFFDLCVVLEQSGRELMPEPLISTLLLGTQALLLGGTDAQKQALLPGVAAGETILALGYEDGASPVVAKKQNERYVLNGEKVQVLDGHVADPIIVSAATDEGTETLFLLDPGASGVTVTRQFRIDGLGAALVAIDQVSVGAEAVVGRFGEGTSLLQQVLDRAAAGVAAQMLGGAEQAFEDTIEYIKGREQFGVPIGSFQALQHRAVSVFTEIALTRSVVLAAARAIDDSPNDVPRLAALANALASETFLQAAKEAIQMHGGIGVTDEHDIGFYMKRAHAAYMTFGQPSQHRQRWAELHGY